MTNSKRLDGRGVDCQTALQIEARRNKNGLQCLDADADDGRGFLMRHIGHGDKVKRFPLLEGKLAQGGLRPGDPKPPGILAGAIPTIRMEAAGLRETAGSNARAHDAQEKDLKGRLQGTVLVAAESLDQTGFDAFVDPRTAGEHDAGESAQLWNEAQKGGPEIRIGLTIRLERDGAHSHVEPLRAYAYSLSPVPDEPGPRFRSEMKKGGHPQAPAMAPISEVPESKPFIPSRF
jgi:hypothetical protein